jgi:hypothetical protein
VQGKKFNKCTKQNPKSPANFDNISVSFSCQSIISIQGRTHGDAQDARAPPPPQPERLVMRKDEAVGNKKKMQVCLPKHNYKLDNNLLTVEPRAVDPHYFDADPDPDPDPDPGGRG